ncbi:hypothetical protein NFI96_002962 [Prochilodus magdalenae]|nr:hypothetical protein NFI96_002962 [Prochilodus magdalenae]
MKRRIFMMDPHKSSGGGEMSFSNWFGAKRAASPESSSVSTKRFKFSSDGGSSEELDPQPQKSKADLSELSCVSMKSSNSMFDPPGFSTEKTGIDLRREGDALFQGQFRCGMCQQLTDQVSLDCKHQCCRKCCRKCLNNYLDKSSSSGETVCAQCGTRSEEKVFCHPTNDVLQRVLERHKTSMKNKCESLFEGIKTEENKILLNRIYTQLYIIEGEREGVNEEHEVLQMENTYNNQLHDVPIDCVHIFKPPKGSKEETEKENIKAVMTKTARPKKRKTDERQKVQKIRTVLTKGIAGIGKTVSVQKFILDWAEGKENQDVDLMFVLPFRELNLFDDQFSLHRLLCNFHSVIKDLDPKTFDVCKVVFIFDGLDENRIPLNFSECEKVSDPTVTSSVGMLITNLIKGELLPSAHIWITSRPAAANQIPPQYISRVTEIQGFDDPQKEEYFRKRISDEDQAKKIISHIRKAKSLHIMCHIPVFCWISATVLQRIMKQRKTTEIPRTLTEMYSHFLLTQTHMKNEKYEEKDYGDPSKMLESNREMILKLAELAYRQLLKGNVMFYEEDLRECGIDVPEASVYSGICTEIFKEESVLYQRKVYCFVHLSFQEFLAAFYTFYCYASKNTEALEFFKPQNTKWSKNVPLLQILTNAVHKAIESENGHLDLFLRFLLGISLGSNQKLLQGLLIYQTRSSKSIRETVKLIKDLIQSKDLPAERSINLFLCLTEMNDQSLSREIQEYLQSQKHSENKLSTAHCSAIAYMLLTSGKELDELDLKKYNTSEKGYRRLIPAVSNCRKALLADCNLTMNHCETLCSALTSTNCSLKELDLSNNHLKDSGVELLFAGLKSSYCKLETLRLALCNIGLKTCENMGSLLKLESSCLKELDLSNNDLQDSGVQLLSGGLKSSQCKLERLRFDCPAPAGPLLPTRLQHSPPPLSYTTITALTSTITLTSTISVIMHRHHTKARTISRKGQSKLPQFPQSPKPSLAGPNSQENS